MKRGSVSNKGFNSIFTLFLEQEGVMERLVEHAMRKHNLTYDCASDLVYDIYASLKEKENTGGGYDFNLIKKDCPSIMAMEGDLQPVEAVIKSFIEKYSRGDRYRDGKKVKRVKEKRKEVIYSEISTDFVIDSDDSSSSTDHSKWLSFEDYELSIVESRVSASANLEILISYNDVFEANGFSIITVLKHLDVLLNATRDMSNFSLLKQLSKLHSVWAELPEAKLAFEELIQFRCQSIAEFDNLLVSAGI